MDALREWLAENFVGCTAPLFEAAGLVVNTFEYRRRKTLKRHPDFDRLMIEKVERGLRQPSWQGFVYVMHWNCGDVSRLYVGKTERCGRKQVVSCNIENFAQIIVALADGDTSVTTISVTSATRCSVDRTKGNSTPSTEGGQTGCLFLTSRHDCATKYQWC